MNQESANKVAKLFDNARDSLLDMAAELAAKDTEHAQIVAEKEGKIADLERLLTIAENQCEEEKRIRLHDAETHRKTEDLLRQAERANAILVSQHDLVRQVFAAGESAMAPNAAALTPEELMKPRRKSDDPIMDEEMRTALAATRERLKEMGGGYVEQFDKQTPYESVVADLSENSKAHIEQGER